MNQDLLKKFFQINQTLDMYKTNYSASFDFDSGIEINKVSNDKKRALVEKYCDERDEIARQLINEYKKKNPIICKSKLLQELEEKKHFNAIICLYEIIDKQPQLLDNEINLKLIIDFCEKGCCQFSYNEIMWEINDFSKEILVDDSLTFFLDEKNLGLFCFYKDLLKSNLLTINEDFKNLIISSIKNHHIYGHYFFKECINDIEQILAKNSQFDKNLLFLLSHYHNQSEHIQLKDYLMKNIDNETLILHLLSIKDMKTLNHSLINDIMESFSEEECLTMESDIQKMKISILRNVQNQDIINNYDGIVRIQEYFDKELEENLEMCIEKSEGNLKESYQKEKDLLLLTFLKKPEIKIAMMTAKSKEQQQKLLQFLEIDELREDILTNPKSIYNNHFLLDEINSEYYGNYWFLFMDNEDIPKESENLKQYLLTLFNQSKLRRIYFFNDNNELKSTPVTFYKQFMENLLNGAYVSQMYDISDDDSFDMPFYNEEILYSYLDGSYLDSAINIIKFGTDKSDDYDINSEIIWNYLFHIAKNEINEKFIADKTNDIFIADEKNSKQKVYK